MEFDLTNLVNSINEEVNAVAKNSNNSNSANSGYPTVYPYVDGQYKFKIFFNPKAGAVQRKITRHDTGEMGKVPCLAAFGETCPVCSAINEAETLKGDGCGALRKYGYKTRGIAFAKLIEAPKKILNEERGITEGAVVLLMYPKTVYDELNKLFADNASQLANIVNNNNCYTISLERATQGGGFPAYRASIPLNGMSPAFDSQEDYDTVLEGLPDIRECVVPSYPNDEVRQSAKTLADTVRAEYINSNVVVNPNADVKTATAQPTVEETKVKAVEQALNNIIEEDIPFDTSDNSRPECFGKYCNETKCMACLSEMDCRKNS